MGKVLITDCGATKCEWAIVEHGEVKYVESDGFNPNVYKEEDLIEKLRKTWIDLGFNASPIDAIYFFGAGCGTQYGHDLVYKSLSVCSAGSKIEVSNDIKGTALALYTQDPIVACIMGTGSASVYFDGKEVHNLRESLGWTIGDEGSGGAIGKLVLRNVFYELWDKEIVADFKLEYPGINVESYLKEVRSSLTPNKFIASFAKFAKKHLGNEYVKKEVMGEIEKFIEWQVAPFCRERGCKASFSGSVAYYFEDLLREICGEKDIEIEKLIAKPLPELVKVFSIGSK